jgi:hypothetical protein
VAVHRQEVWNNLDDWQASEERHATRSKRGLQ